MAGNIFDWELYYQEHLNEGMPWYIAGLDPDFLRSLQNYYSVDSFASLSVLDLGSGPATQAIALSRLGMRVTATDISATAISRGKILARQQEVEVDFQRDDILDTQLSAKGKKFKIIFDRGCFHTLEPEDRVAYLEQIKKLMEPGAHLFLKTFSVSEPGDRGPYRFSPQMILEYFSASFLLLSLRESEFEGEMRHNPLALYAEMQASF